MREFFKPLSWKKLEMHHHQGKITVPLLLSFLTVETERNKTCLGSSNGWTQHRGPNGLIVSGGFVNGVELLNSVQYGTNLDNCYNNFVNPFYLFDIMTEEGKSFFLDLYRDDILELMNKEAAKVASATPSFKRLRDFWEQYGIVPEISLPLEEENKRLREALEQYADKMNWGFYDMSGCEKGHGRSEDACFLGTDIARAALNGGKND
jgi:hypothetical protein